MNPSCASSDTMSSRGHTSLQPEEMEVDPDEPKHKDSKRQCELIIGVTDFYGTFTYLVKFKGREEAVFIPSEEASREFPQEIIEYYSSLEIEWF